jgi:hypothetical protein
LQDFNIGAGEEVNMRIRWPGWPAVVALLVVCLTMPAVAQQTWPQRTVKLIVPLGPGSGADIGARLMADHLSKRLGQPVIVENRPGGEERKRLRLSCRQTARNDREGWLRPHASIFST